MNTSEMFSSLFHKKECPFNYHCLASDCFLCAQQQTEMDGEQITECEKGEGEV